MSPDVKVDSIADDLRQRIIDGEYGTAGRLPPLRMLAEEYQTTNETMNKVVQLLQIEGMIYSLGRTGLFVRKVRTRISGIAPRFDLLLEQQGLPAIEVNIDEPAIVPASGQVASVFGIEEGAPVVRRFRRQGTLNLPYRLAENFYPLELAGGEILERLQQDIHYDVLEAIQKTHHKVIRKVHEDLSVRLPTSHEQELLNIVRTAPVLEILRKNYSSEEDGTIILFNRLVYVAMYCEFSYEYLTDYWLNK